MDKKIARVIYLITYILTISVFVLTLFYYFYTPAPKDRPPQDSFPKMRGMVDISNVIGRNIFNIDGIFPEPGQQKQPALICVGTPKQSSVPFQVIGIIFGGNSQSSIAILKSKNSDQILILKNNDTLPDELGSISDIDAKRVWITNTGCPQYLELPKPFLPSSRVRKGSGQGSASDKSYSESGFERVGTNTQVTRDWVDDILNNKLNNVLNDAYVVPHMANGKIDGFTISQIEPMSVYDKLGLKNGDIISAINGISLNDAGRAIQTLNGLRNESRITLKVIRNGQPTTFKVNVK